MKKEYEHILLNTSSLTLYQGRGWSTSCLITETTVNGEEFAEMLGQHISVQIGAIHQDVMDQILNHCSTELCLLGKIKYNFSELELFVLLSTMVLW